MALLADAMCGGRHDSCYRKRKYARASHGMGSESLSRRVGLLFAQELCFLKQEHSQPSDSEQEKTGVLLTTDLGLLRGHRVQMHAAGKSIFCCSTKCGINDVG